jgi:hypothetical protein
MGFLFLLRKVLDLFPEILLHGKLYRLHGSERRDFIRRKTNS